jgi:hypothetical protein
MMSSSYKWVVASVVLATGFAVIFTWSSLAAGGPGYTWTITTLADFAQGTMQGVDVWSLPGTVRLDRQWSDNVKVNNTTDDARFSPSLSYDVDTSGPLTRTVFLAVWADEDVQDHYPDILFATRAEDSATWSADVQLSGAHVNGVAYDKPDIAVRGTTGDYYVIWQNDSDGDLYYATSGSQGATWTSSAPVRSRSDIQTHPRLAGHDPTGVLYAVWQEAPAGDEGDIYISRHPSHAWTMAIKVSDDGGTETQRTPAVATGPDGSVYVAWEDTRANDDGEIYFSRWLTGSAWSGAGWGANTRLSDAGMDWAASPDLIVDATGVLYASWMERVPTGPATYDFQIVVARSQDRGDTWSRTVVQRLYGASASLSSYDFPSLGVDGRGKVFVAWTSMPDQNDPDASDVLVALSPDGGEHWTQPKTLNSQPTVVGSLPSSLISDEKGVVSVAWADYRETHPHIFASHYPTLRHLTHGIYTSPILDAGGPAAWGTITWTATTPPGSGLNVATCALTQTGTPCSQWRTVGGSGASISAGSSPYLQVRVVLSRTVGPGSSPVLHDLSVTYEHYRIYLPLTLR